MSMKHLDCNNPHSIYNGYVVTEKADGIRAQLLISQKEDGKAYLITPKKKLFQLALDMKILQPIGYLMENILLKTKKGKYQTIYDFRCLLGY